MQVQNNNYKKLKKEKKIILFLVVSIVLIYSLWLAQETGFINLTRYSNPVKTDQAIYDFGKVAAGSVVNHTFILKNTGKDVLNIKQLSCSCACTGAVITTKKLESDCETQIKISLKTSGYMGELRQKCLVQFEQKDITPVMLEVVADIYSPTANFSVNRLYFDKIVFGTQATKNISIIDVEHLDERLAIDNVKVSSDFIEISYNKGVIQCTIDSNAPIGVIDEKILVSLKDPNGISNIEIPIEGRVVQAYEVYPEHIFLGRVNSGQDQPIIKFITVVNLKDDVPSDIQLAIENKNVQIRVESRNENSIKCSLEFNLPIESGFFEDEILLKINDKDMNDINILRIPYSGIKIAQ